MEPPEHIQIMNGDAYELVGKSFKVTWLHQRRKRRMKLRKNEEENNSTKSDESCSNKRKHETDIDIDDENCKRIKIGDNDELNQLTKKYDGDNYVTIGSSENLEHKNLESVEDNHENCLFSFSCTVSSARQCHVPGGKTPVISLMCDDGDRNHFHQLFLYLKNKFHCNQVKTLS